MEGFCTTQRTLLSLLDNLDLELDLLLLACVEVEDGVTPVSKSKQLSSFAARLFEEEQETTALRVISAIAVGCCCWVSL